MENFYLIYGPDSGLIKENCQKIIALLKIEEINIIEYDYETTAFEEIMQEVITIPFFAEKKAIIIKNAAFLEKSTNADISPLLSYMTNPLKENYLLITYKGMLDQKFQNVKDLKKYSQMVFVEGLDKKKLAELIKTQAKEKTYAIDNEAIEELILRKDGDYSGIVSELEKLYMYCLKDKVISKLSITNLVPKNPEDKVYELTNVILKKDVKSSMEIYQDLLALGEDSSRLFSNISNKFREIFLIKQMLEAKKSKEEIAQFFNVSSGRAYYMIKSATETSYSDLGNCIDRLVELDKNIKTGKSDKKLGLEIFILNQKGL
ncbi:MAG: DNA polymerase III subunit delta [Erysipelotrichales bacterium]|nr:DNA polymerase III subunit delta [Erysipelotrichales bacterium]